MRPPDSDLDHPKNRDRKCRLIEVALDRQMCESVAQTRSYAVRELNASSKLILYCAYALSRLKLPRSYLIAQEEESANVSDENGTNL